jgi:tRNA G10  N-methylase Trm11
MNDSIAILGRQPALGLAELESLYGDKNVTPIGSVAAKLSIMPCSIEFSRLGGTIKLCKTLKMFDTTSWHDIESYLVNVSPEHSKNMPSGKMHLGLSAYEVSVSPKQLLATGLKIKKAINQATGRTVRLVPNINNGLNSAQVLHNKLLTTNGWELVVVRSGQKSVLAQTLSIQDIENYGLRDYGRPKRDTRIGMLPPKLAQIILNLAIGPQEFAQVSLSPSGSACFSPEDNQKMRELHSHTVILDPFCGTGVLLQEALHMGYGVLGSDIEPRMVDYTNQNLRWLTDHYKSSYASSNVAAGDATSLDWSQPIDVVASEVYLGRPFTALPDAEILAQTVSDCNTITKKFLKNIHRQLKSGARLCLALPAWQVKPSQFRHLPLVDHLGDLGYNRLSFEHVRNEDLIYYRADQVVARELLVLTRS